MEIGELYITVNQMSIGGIGAALLLVLTVTRYWVKLDENVYEEVE